MENIKFKHSLLIEERQLRDDQLASKERIIRKRWIVFGTIALTILLAFSISAGVVSHQHKVIEKQLEDMENKIAQAQQAIKYKKVNKTIIFKEEDYLRLLTIKSQMRKQTQEKCIRNLDLSKSEFKILQNIWLPSVIDAQMCSKTQSIIACSFGFEELSLKHLPNLSSMTRNNFKVKQLDTYNTRMKSMLNNAFGELTTLKIQNQQASEFSDILPNLQQVLLNNSIYIYSISFLNSTKLSTIKCQNCSGGIFYLKNTNVRSLSGLCTFKNINIVSSPIEEIGCSIFPNLLKLSFNQTSLINLTIAAPKLRQLVVTDSPTQQITLFKNSEPMSDIRLQNISMPKLQNFNNLFHTLLLDSNKNLTLISNNNWLITGSILCYGCEIENFTNNNLPNLRFINLVGFQRGKLRYYSNNNNPILTKLDLSYNQIRRISKNDFSSLNQLLIGSNYLGQVGIQILITNNTWGKGTLKTINITDNNISNKLPIMNRLLNFFPGVQVFI